MELCDKGEQASAKVPRWLALTKAGELWKYKFQSLVMSNTEVIPTVAI